MKNSINKEMNLFKVGKKSAGLDLVHLNYCPDSSILENGKFGYIHTSTNCINESILADFIDLDVKNYELVTEVDCITKIGQVVLSHLTAINRDWVDILEIPAECDWSEDTVDQLKTLFDSGIIYEISIKNPNSTERLDEIKKLLSDKSLEISYVSLDICPLNFNLDIINWCNNGDNFVNIIGYNPFGGYINHANVINSFSAPYLLGFAATYCSVVFLSSRDLFKSIQSAEYLSKLYDKVSEPMYTLKKSVYKLQKPLKKVIHTSMILDTNTNVPYNTPDFVPTGEDSILISLGKQIESIPEADEFHDPNTEFEKEIYTFLQSLNYPIDASEKTKFCLAKNQIINYIRTKFNGCNIMCSIINDTAIAVIATKENITRNWLRKKKETISNSYIITMKLDGTVYFKEC